MKFVGDHIRASTCNDQRKSPLSKQFVHLEFNENLFLSFIECLSPIQGLELLLGAESGDFFGVLSVFDSGFLFVVVFRFGASFDSGDGDVGGSDSDVEPSLDLNKFSKQVRLEIKVRGVW